MLFTDTSKALLDKIEQVIRLIRSKGVGIYFITQSPTDIPESIRISSNRKLPVYSQLAKVEVVPVPFEKTPKMSIKRFLYK